MQHSSVNETAYLYAANYLKRLQPDLLIGGHSFVMPEPAAFIDRYHRWAQDIIRAYQGLLPGSEYRYRFDPYWVKAEPYRVSLDPGRSAEVRVVVGSTSRASFPVRLRAMFRSSLIQEIGRADLRP